MNDDEEVVSRYLKRRYEEVIYEPEGQDTAPDFSVNGGIAVEVTRLTQHNFTSADQATSTQEGFHRYIDWLNTQLRDFNYSGWDNSWAVKTRFDSSVSKNKLKSIKPDIYADLKKFKERSDKCSGVIHESSTTKISVERRPPREDFYYLSTMCDKQQIGWDMPYPDQNIKYVVNKKSCCLKRIRHLGYEKSWLILVDCFRYCQNIGSFQKQQFDHDWDRLALINPLSPDDLYDID